MAPRLKDIAAELGVSTITVSKVLRNKPDIGARTRERVLQKLRELNYKPNMLARGLASGQSFTVGLVVPDIIDSFFAELARSVGASLRSKGYQLILASADDDPDVERVEIENLCSRGVDALLIAPSQRDAERLKKLLPESIPFVMLDRAPAGLASYFVGTDNVRAGLIATEHLIQQGRKHIAHIGAVGPSSADARHEGYKRALKAAHLPYRKDAVVLKELHRDRHDVLGGEAMHQLLQNAQRPDAVFCHSDLLAVGAIREVLRAGLRVPEDVAVIGCNNLPFCEYLEVPLSSVEQGTVSIGESAATLALDLIGGEAQAKEKATLIQPTVVVRSSTVASASKPRR